MYSEILGHSAYQAALVSAVVVGNVTLALSARLFRLPTRRFCLLGITLSALMLVGAKGYAMTEQAFAGRMVEPSWSEGYRQPGVLLAVIVLPFVVRLFLPHSSLGHVADALILPAAVGLALFRAACLLRGCCFGTISIVPWALRFPAESPPWKHHQDLGFLWGYEDASLPVHPLQIYFALAVVLSAGLALLLRNRRILRAGQAFIVFA